MAQPRKHVSNAQRQAVYRQRRQEVQAALMVTGGLPPLPAISRIPARARWRAALKQVRLIAQTVAREMTDYYDQRSEAWKDTEQAEQLQEQIDALIELVDKIEELEQP
jgi:hypothetical protein